MDSAGPFHHNIRTLNVSGGTFQDVRGDVNNHYHIHNNYEPELRRGKRSSFRVDETTLKFGCIRDRQAQSSGVAWRNS